MAGVVCFELRGNSLDARISSSGKSPGNMGSSPVSANTSITSELE